MTEASATIKHRVEIFSAGCNTCRRTIAEVRGQIDSRHDIVVHDLHNDAEAAKRADGLGIHTVPAVVVDGSLLACCKNTGPTIRELKAAGVARADLGS